MATRVKLRDSPSEFKVKVGLTDDFGSAYKRLNDKASKISSERFGMLSRSQISSQNVDTHPAIEELKLYFESEALENKRPDNQPSLDKIREVLRVHNAATWLIHRAITRNYENYSQ